MIEIIGEPKLITKNAVKQTINECFSKLKIDSNKIVEIMFVSKDKIKDLNFIHRKINRPTDVLSFPQADVACADKQILGSIVICEEIAEKLSGNDVDLLEHGFLHLLGYDHEIDAKKWNDAKSKIKLKMNHENS